MKKAVLAMGAALLLFSCSEHPGIEEIKENFGDFGNATIKWLMVDYTKAPIYNRVKHQPEHYEYLNDVNIYSMAHVSDGLFLKGFMVAPKKEGKYPVIVYNRGGNQDLGLLLVATAIDVMAPLAAQGYVVVATNYRGNSISEGKEQFGGDDVNDIKNLIKSMGEFKKADNSKVGLLGVSRGAMMSYLTLKDAAGLNIKAVVTIGGITDLETTIKYHPEIEEVAQELIPGFESDRNAQIKKRSAMYWTNQLPNNVPLLLMHSKTDEHVHYSQIPVFADSLEKNNIPYNLISFEEDKHGLLEHQDIVEKAILQWFNTYVKEEAPFVSKTARKTIK